MSTSDLVGHSVASVARDACWRLGILGTSVRDLTEARRWITVSASTAELFRFLSDPDNLSWAMEAAGVPDGPGVPKGDQRPGTALRATMGPSTKDRRLAWSFEGAGRRGSGWIELRRAPGEPGTEVTGCLRFEHVEGRSALTFTQSAGVLLTRMLRRTKAFMEAGGDPPPAHNPAQRPASHGAAPPKGSKAH